MKWKKSDIDKLVSSGKVRACSVINALKAPKSGRELQKAVQSSPKAVQFFKNTLEQAGIPYLTEHRFHPVRQFRFDIAIPDKMVAIEYEGLMSAKSGHTTIRGYTKDTTKYNLAQSMGWRVFRYTALNYQQFADDIKVLYNA